MAHLVEGLMTGRNVYSKKVSVVSNLVYAIKIEVLQNDLGAAHEKVSHIVINGVNYGECNPPGKDKDCTFYDCTPSLKSTTVVSTTDVMSFKLAYQHHSRDCNCNLSNWECQSEDLRSNGRAPIIAAARITLTPIHGKRI